MKLAVTGIADRAIVAHAKKAIAGNGHIQRIIGTGHISLVKLLRHRQCLGANADLNLAAADRTGINIRKLRL